MVAHCGLWFFFLLLLLALWGRKGGFGFGDMCVIAGFADLGGLCGGFGGWAASVGFGERVVQVSTLCSGALVVGL